MAECEMCKLFIKMIEENRPPFDKLSEDSKKYTIEGLKINYLNEPTGWARGFNLCSLHLASVKKDNKYRTSVLGEDIPDTLELKRITSGDY